MKKVYIFALIDVLAFFTLLGIVENYINNPFHYICVCICAAILLIPMIGSLLGIKYLDEKVKKLEEILNTDNK